MNYSQFRPEEAVSPTVFMPSRHDSTAAAAEREWDEETTERIADYTSLIHDLACRQRQEAAARGE